MDAIDGEIQAVLESARLGFIQDTDVIPMLRGLRRKHLERDVLLWGKYYFPEKFDLDFCEELHGYLCSIGTEAFTDTLAPRGHAKTTICCFLLPIFYACAHPHLFRHYLNVQATSLKAISINQGIKIEFETNERIREDYGDLVSGEKWTDKQFVLRNGVIFSGIGAGESMRGISYRNVRPDYINLDDLYNEDDLNNIDRIRKKNRWFWSSLYPARAVGRRTSIHITGTAISKADLMHELKTKDGVVFRKFQAIINDRERKTLWRPYDVEMADKELMGSHIYNREYQNDPRADEDAIIKEGWIQFYDGEIPSYDRVLENMLGVDPATGEHEHNDPTGMANVKRTLLGNYYIHEVKNEHLSLHQRIVTIDNWNARAEFDRVYVEAISGFNDFCNELKRTTRVPVKRIASVKDKITCKENQSAKFENGKVFINKNIPRKLLDELVEQLTNNKPAHDDIADAVLRCMEAPQSRETRLSA